MDAGIPITRYWFSILLVLNMFITTGGVGEFLKLLSINRGPLVTLAKLQSHGKQDKGVGMVMVMWSGKATISMPFTISDNSAPSRSTHSTRFPAGCNCRVRAFHHQLSLLPFVAVPLQYITLNRFHQALLRLYLPTYMYTEYTKLA